MIFHIPDGGDEGNSSLCNAFWSEAKLQRKTHHGTYYGDFRYPWLTAVGALGEAFQVCLIAGIIIGLILFGDFPRGGTSYMAGLLGRRGGEGGVSL